MRLDWDYTGLAEAYAKRPGYAPGLLSRSDALRDLPCGSARPRACDVGAGTGNLTVLLAEHAIDVVACEPNRDMRAVGRRRTRQEADVQWVSGYAEALPLASDGFDLVTFGSSLNVTDTPIALGEAARLLRAGGRLVCAWNHRSLDDPLQRAIQSAIARHVPSFSHGSRRADQTPILEAAGLFGPVARFEHPFVARTTRTDCFEAWQTHLSLARQAGEHFPLVLQEIWDLLDRGRGPDIEVPYVTRLWSCRKLESS